MAAESEEVELETEPEAAPAPEAAEEMEDLWAKLPEEVQQKIFKRLRWRSLFRMCVVSKSFNDGVNRYVHELPLFRTAVVSVHLQ